jgi:hypothetical protein
MRPTITYYSNVRVRHNCDRRREALDRALTYCEGCPSVVRGRGVRPLGSPGPTFCGWGCYHESLMLGSIGQEDQNDPA